MTPKYSSPFLCPTVDLGRNGRDRLKPAMDRFDRGSETYREASGQAAVRRAGQGLCPSSAAQRRRRPRTRCSPSPSAPPPSLRLARLAFRNRRASVSQASQSSQETRSAPRSLSLPLLPSLLTFASRNQLGVEMHDTCWAILNFALGVSRF